MATNYKQAGEVIDYTNGGGSTIPSGSVVKINQILGVAIADILTTETGPVQIDGVFEVPKVTTAVIAQGESLLWDVSAGKFDAKSATPATGDVSGSPAVAFKAAANGDTTLWVMFTGVPGTVT